MRPAFEPCLFELESLLPGNGILRAEIKSYDFTETAAETKLTPQLGQFGARYQTAGKSLRKSECVVGPGGLHHLN
jgi:hypothetical protein